MEKIAEEKKISEEKKQVKVKFEDDSEESQSSSSSDLKYTDTFTYYHVTLLQTINSIAPVISLPFIPAPEAVAALTTVELSELRLKSILYCAKSMKCISFKFSNGRISPPEGTYSNEADSETDIL